MTFSSPGLTVINTLHVELPWDYGPFPYRIGPAALKLPLVIRSRLATTTRQVNERVTAAARLCVE